MPDPRLTFSSKSNKIGSPKIFLKNPKIQLDSTDSISCENVLSKNWKTISAERNSSKAKIMAKKLSKSFPDSRVVNPNPSLSRKRKLIELIEFESQNTFILNRIVSINSYRRLKVKKISVFATLFNRTFTVDFGNTDCLKYDGKNCRKNESRDFLVCEEKVPPILVGCDSEGEIDVTLDSRPGVAFRLWPIQRVFHYNITNVTLVILYTYIISYSGIQYVYVVYNHYDVRRRNSRLTTWRTRDLVQPLARAKREAENDRLVHQYPRANRDHLALQLLLKSLTD